MPIQQKWTAKKIELCNKAMEHKEVGYNAENIFEADKFKQVLRQYIRKMKLPLTIRSDINTPTTFYLIKVESLKTEPKPSASFEELLKKYDLYKDQSKEKLVNYSVGDLIDITNDFFLAGKQAGTTLEVGINYKGITKEEQEKLEAQTATQIFAELDKIMKEGQKIGFDEAPRHKLSNGTKTISINEIITIEYSHFYDEYLALKSKYGIK